MLKGISRTLNFCKSCLPQGRTSLPSNIRGKGHGGHTAYWANQAESLRNNYHKLRKAKLAVGMLLKPHYRLSRKFNDTAEGS
jgi:hypothetical protein